MAEWIVINGHVLGHCAYLRSLDDPWEAESPCDCRDLLEEDPLWGEDDEPSFAEGMHVAMDNTLAPDIGGFQPRWPMRKTGPTSAVGLRSRPKPMPKAVLDGLAARSGGSCEAALPGCLGRATDPCHRVGRAQGGAHTLENIWHGCRMCHDWTHAHVAEAVDLGLILKSWQDPATEPMAYRNRGWALLGTEVTWL